MLEFTSITLKNFGPYKGTQRIELPNRNGVIIFWGDNGRGKTTLLNAFRFALFGTIQRRNRALNTLMSMENTEARNSGEYGFSIVLEMRSGNDAFMLTREYVSRDGISIPQSEADYIKRHFLKKNGSLLSNEDADHELSMLLPEHVSRFFLFDGELLQEYEELLIDDTTTGERIKSAIERILGVPVLINGRQDIDSIRSQLVRQKSKAVRNDDQTTQYSNELDSVEAGISEHKTQIRALDQELKEQYAAQVNIENQMHSTEQLREWQMEMDSLKREIERNNDALASQQIEMRATMRDAWRGVLKSRIEEHLTDLMERKAILEVKHRKKAIAEQALEDIRKAIDEHVCPVCDQSIQGIAFERLSQRLSDGLIDEGLNAEETIELEDISEKANKLSRLVKESSRSRVRGIEQQISSLGIALDSNSAKLRDVQQRLAQFSSGDVDELRDLPKKYTRVVQKISNLNDAKRAETEKLNEKNASRDKIMAQISKLESGSDLRDASLKLELCEQLYQLFDEGIGKYRDALKGKVESVATELFTSITGDADYVALKINDNYGLNIVHRSGSLVPGRSSGYEHIVALSLIGALHKNSPLGGPIIMDSPFGRLDKTHKSKLTATLPNMADQIILFTYNGEIDRTVAINNLNVNLQREYTLERISSMHTNIKQGV